jgi:hypothetical protein
LRVVCLLLVGVPSTRKLAMLLACFPLLAVRLRVAKSWVMRFRRA